MASDRQTDRQPDTVSPIYPLFFKGGIITLTQKDIFDSLSSSTADMLYVGKNESAMLHLGKTEDRIHFSFKFVTRII